MWHDSETNLAVKAHKDLMTELVCDLSGQREE